MKLFGLMILGTSLVGAKVFHPRDIPESTNIDAEKGAYIKLPEPGERKAYIFHTKGNETHHVMMESDASPTKNDKTLVTIYARNKEMGKQGDRQEWNDLLQVTNLTASDLINKRVGEDGYIVLYYKDGIFKFSFPGEETENEARFNSKPKIKVMRF